MPPYCATELQGYKCTDNQCQYRHDILRCELCGRSFPAPLLNQHENGKLHLSNVYLSGLLSDHTTDIDSWGTAQSPPSQSTSRSPQLPVTSPPPEGDTLITVTVADPRVIVSGEEGLNFIVEGKGTAACPNFPVVNCNITIEKTEVVSSLFVESITLAYSPGQHGCFHASLGNQNVTKKKPRTIIVSFKPPHAGTFHATMKIIFSDRTRRYDGEFTVTRELRGHASLPASASLGSASDGDVPTVSEETTEDELKDPGITISPDFALDFSIESLQPNEEFATQTKELILTRSSYIFVSFIAARIYSPEASVIESFSAKLEGDSRVMKPNQSRIVTVSFSPQQEGLCEAVLELIFHNHKRKVDFVVKRTLTGWAKRPTSRMECLQKLFASSPVSRPIITDVGDHRHGWGVYVDGGERFIDSDVTGISVSHEDGLDFGIVERKRPNGPFVTPSSLLTIKHAYDVPAVTFVKEKTRTLDGSDPEFVAVFEGDSLNIQPGTESPVRVIFSPKFEGLFKATLELVFYHSHRRDWFVVRRMLQGTAGSLEDHKHLESLGKEDNDKPTESSHEVPPQKIIHLLPRDQRRKPRYFPDYEVPPMVQQAINNSNGTRPYDKYAPDLVSALRPDSLNTNTYAHYFGSLLSVEDGHQQYVRSSRWDVLCGPANEDNVQGHGQQYSVEIENDDEDLLPEVVLGDFLWLDDIKNNIRYEACVTKTDVSTRHHLAVLKMLVRLPPDFNLCQGTQFVLQLRHNRITLRHRYHTLTSSFTSPHRLLFPTVSDIKPNRHLSRAETYNLKFRHLVNRTIRDDPQQLQAVVSVLEQPPGSVPFIVYGPPGTGKTSTIIESIVQLVRRDEGVRVLACTPSDGPTHLLAERLTAAGLDSARLYRLDASLPFEEDVSDDTRAISRTPGHERLLAFSVVLSTCSKAAILQNLDVPVGHFSHIIIDEAAQAEEPLVMIPIMTFSSTYTNIILSGDPNQLGPIIESPTAARSGLGMSYIQRLMLLRDVYSVDTQIGKTIVVLRRNWRSHGAIIAWSNQYLYEDMMRDYGNSYITYHLVNSDLLPKEGFPVVFHGVRGNEERTKSSPSYFNVLEASIIRNYCVELISDPERNIYPEEIGILAPYRAQVRAIRQLLKAAKLSDISVGPLEQFQGQERKVIILATTRSNEESHPRKSLGLLVNRQRMNVAITRAQALLIVIGDPEVLGKYEHWRTFLKYVKSHKGWTGRMHNWDDEEAVPPAYEIIPRKGGVAHGEEFIDGKSEKIYRSVVPVEGAGQQ